MTASRKLRTASDSRAPSFQKILLKWYDGHARVLPWRETRDPYRVWVSEIMLQQTRVAAVIAHYYEFLRRFPTVGKLAAAREASVLAAWSGLGYYRRARMLHAAAKVVARELGGDFPTTAEGWRALPGIGRYTAAAIASIAFDEAIAVVDGNVERVLQRVSGKRLAGEGLWDAAEAFLNRERPGDSNQAMMELGAIVCTPRAPACLTCPVVELCATRGELAGGVKTARQAKREIHCALDFRGGKVFLVQRPLDASLMAGMWELPEMDSPASGAKAPFNVEDKIAALEALRHPKAKRGIIKDRRGSDESELRFTLRHSITVTDYKVHIWRCAAPESAMGEWIAVRRLGKIAMTGLARKILRRAGWLKDGYARPLRGVI